MENTQFLRLLKTDGGFSGKCPRCDEIIFLSSAIEANRHWTGELKCPECCYFVRKETSSPDELMFATRAHFEQAPYDSTLKRLAELSTNCDTLISKLWSNMQKNANAVAEKNNATLSKLTRETENLCAVIQKELSSSSLEEALQKTSASVSEVRKLLANAKTISDTFVTMNKNVGIINKALAPCAKQAQDILRAADIIYSNGEAGKPVAPPLPASDYKRLYLTEISQERNRAFEELPLLFDAIEQELFCWKQSNREVALPEGRENVVAVLTKLLHFMESWRAVHGLIRFGNPGDRFDEARHELYAVEETADEGQFNTLKETVYSGYLLRGSEQVFRRARVIVWVQARQPLPVP